MVAEKSDSTDTDREIVITRLIDAPRVGVESLDRPQSRPQLVGPGRL